MGAEKPRILPPFVVLRFLVLLTGTSEMSPAASLSFFPKALIFFIWFEMALSVAPLPKSLAMFFVLDCLRPSAVKLSCEEERCSHRT